MGGPANEQLQLQLFSYRDQASVLKLVFREQDIYFLDNFFNGKTLLTFFYPNYCAHPSVHASAS